MSGYLKKERQNVVFKECYQKEVSDQRQYSQSGNDRDEMVEIKKSRVSCYNFFIHEQSDTVKKV
jgi:hypothetical protein